MKKLLAAACCVLALQSFLQVKPGTDTSVKADGRRVLIKAIALIVNTEANRKMPPRQVYIPSADTPKI